MAKDVARPEAGQDALEAIQRLTDLANDDARAGLTHSGRTVTVTLGTSNTEVAHLLDRVPTIIFALKKNANAVVYTDTEHADPRRFAYVKASATVTVTLLIA